MGHLMGDEGRERAIAGYDRRCRERQPRVLHATERETRRQYDHIVTLPAIRPVQALGDLEHAVHVRELPCRFVHDTSFSIYPGP